MNDIVYQKGLWFGSCAADQTTISGLFLLGLAACFVVVTLVSRRYLPGRIATANSNWTAGNLMLSRGMAKGLLVLLAAAAAIIVILAAPPVASMFPPQIVRLTIGWADQRAAAPSPGTDAGGRLHVIQCHGYSQEEQAHDLAAVILRHVQEKRGQSARQVLMIEKREGGDLLGKVDIVQPKFDFAVLRKIAPAAAQDYERALAQTPR